MKACLLTTSFPAFKGHLQSPFIYELASAIVKSGVDVDVVCPFYGESRSKKEVLDGMRVRRFQYFFPLKLQKLTSGGGIPTNLKSSFLAKIQLVFFMFAMFFKAIKSVKSCDVIHAQWALSALVGVFLKKFYKKPLILTTRGAAVNLALKNKFAKKVLLFILNNCDYVTPNNFEHEKLLENLVKKGALKTVPNGVDSNKFKPRSKLDARKKLNLPLDKKIVLSIGWLIPRKGFNYLIDAVPEVLKKNKDVLFLIIGEGVLEKELLSQIERLNLKGSVKLVGSKSPVEIPLWMNAADIFILCSLSEGRPNVVPEALASGMAVVATRVSGTPEFIDNKKNGLLIQPKSSGAIAEALNTLLGNDKLISALASASRPSVAEKSLSWESSAEAYVKIYKSVCGVK